jgi:transposase-like protein
MVDRSSGEIITKVVPDSSANSLHPEILNHVAAGSTLHTDEWSAYRRIKRYGFKHRTVNHSLKEYVRGITHTNTLEGYFSILKRSIRSTHIWVSAKHLPKYLAEFEFRWNQRAAAHLMFQKLLLGFVTLRPKGA